MDNRIRILVVRDTAEEAYQTALRIGEQVPCIIDSHGIDQQSKPGWRDPLIGQEYDLLDADVSCGNDRLSFYRTRVRYSSKRWSSGLALLPPQMTLGAFCGWALVLYRECQRDAAGDPWYEPGGAERRFIAKLREYACCT